MRTVYTLQTTVWNGTHAIQSHVDVFLDKDLAERTLKALEEANKYCPYHTTTKLEEATLFEKESDVAILRETHQENNPTA